MFEAYNYGVHPETFLLDYDKIREMAREIKPLILLAGYSSYPRKINFRKMREIADEVGAVFMVDMAHFAGLVAGGVFTGDFNPIPHAHIVTSTTHKTLRGPRGGIILSTGEFAEFIDKGCPLVIGGPLGHIVAAKAVALAEANTPEFRTYAHRIVENAQMLAEAIMEQGLKLSTGGTDNHLMLIDVRPLGLTGRQAAGALRQCGITLNYNSLPYDTFGPTITSGLRLGTPAVTTLGMGEEEMKEIAAVIKLALSNTRPGTIESGPNAGKPSKTRFLLNEAALEGSRKSVERILAQFPVYPQLDLEFLKKYF
jgi:glycine hydroxymethyltransferase